ncbi:YibE/F family protein [Sporosarcina luteola]|uniref:YibE/F family protein n=1 Tax=Bacillales TaxID=1385 RepID=UPI00203F966A|nr:MULTISPECIES: YibE/F family protein [Bacillales]MCM3639494.1 YibE/F family protein [Sporosarcina luteola]
MNVIKNRLKKMTYKQILLFTVIGLCFAISMIFINNNYSFYEQPIAKVIQTELVEASNITDMNNNKDRLFIQQIIAEIKNGEYKGQSIQLTNKYSSSGAYDQQFRVGNELFVSIDTNKKKDSTLIGSITNVKRDQFVVLVAWIFIFILLITGKKQGLLSIMSLAVNATLLSFALDLYIKYPSISLVLICAVSGIVFTIISLTIVSGFNEKTYAAIIATLLGTVISLCIAYIVIGVTSGNGLRYEEMQFLTRPYQMVFMAGLLIGSLGAVMDVAITMSSSLFALYEQNNDISVKALKASGIDIGKDIMGTITSILFFAYISGSIPVIILYLKNASLLGFTLSMNLSLELARALVGGIGIVLTIPIGLYTTLYFVNRKRARS